MDTAVTWPRKDQRSWPHALHQIIVELIFDFCSTDNTEKLELSTPPYNPANTTMGWGTSDLLACTLAMAVFV